MEGQNLTHGDIRRELWSLAWPGFWIFFLRLGVISIPLSYLLTNVFNLSIITVWGSLIAGNVIASVVGYFWINKTLDQALLKGVSVK